MTTNMQMTTKQIEAANQVIDYGDYQWDVLAHQPSGERYLVSTCTVCAEGTLATVGSTMTHVYGPLHHSEIETLTSGAITVDDFSDNFDDITAEQDAAWANTQAWAHYATVLAPPGR